MVSNATFNNSSAVSWWSVLWMEVTGMPGQIHRLPLVTDALYIIMLYRVNQNRAK